LLGVEYQIGWLNPAARACAALKREDVDLILATGPPFLSFRLAAQIAMRLNRPYVLDYRDLWTDNPFARRLARPSAMSEERLLIAGAAAVTVVSNRVADSLQENYSVGDKVCVVTNGYDPEDLSGVQPRSFGHFAIVYTGQFYPPKHVIDPLLAALVRLKTMPSVKRDWKFHYFGPHGALVREAIENKDLASDVVVHGNVPRRDALAALAGADLSIVITSVRESGSFADLGVVTGKVFEAIGLKKPVLAIAPRGSDLEKILTTSGLGQRFSGAEVELMARFIADLVNGRRVVPREPENYSWTEIGDNVDAVLRGIVAARPAFRAKTRLPSAEGLPRVY